MITVIGNTPSYDKIDKYVCFYDRLAYWKYTLVGKAKSCSYFYIADCTSKDELAIWADLHGITIDKFVDVPYLKINEDEFF